MWIWSVRKTHSYTLMKMDGERIWKTDIDYKVQVWTKWHTRKKKNTHNENGNTLSSMWYVYYYNLNL